MLNHNKNIWLNLRRLFGLNWDNPLIESQPVTVLNDKTYYASTAFGSVVSTSTSANIFSVLNDGSQEFYITNMQLSLQHSTTGTSTFVKINATINGTVTTVAVIATLTLNTCAQNMSVPCMIKVDKGTTITVTQDGTGAISGAIHGFYVNAV